MRRQGAGGWASSRPGRPQSVTRRGIRVGGGASQRGRGTKAAEVEARYSEMEQQLKNLQLPAACSFVLALAERVVRSSSSREMSASASLPNKKTTLALIDTFILRIPPHTRGKGAWSAPRTEPDKKVFTPFEELELLDALRVQIEERQTMREMQLILFDAIFGLGSEEKLYSDQRTAILQKLVSLGVSVGSPSILTCAAFWMELHPQSAKDLAALLYFEFCELLPQAMDPLLQLASLCPPLAKQLAVALTALHPLHTVKDKSGGGVSHPTSKLCPPIKLLQLVTHWMTTSPEFITAPPVFTEMKDKGLVLLRSQLPQLGRGPSPLKGLAQWCIVEPLLPTSVMLTLKGNRSTSTSKTEDDTVTSDSKQHEFRSLTSRLHADLLTTLTVLPKGVIRELFSTDELVVLVASLLDFGQHVQTLSQPPSSEGHQKAMEAAMDRLAQLLQIGLSTGAIVLQPEELASIASTVPKNRLLNLVVSHHQTTQLKS